MTTDNRTNEPTEAMILAALNAYANAGLEVDGYEPTEDATRLEVWGDRYASQMRAALVAAQGAAPPVNSFGTSAERVKNGADSLHVEPRAESDCWHEANCSCPSVLPSSGVDEDALARLLCEKNYVSPDGKPTCAACRDKAHEVAAWLKVQGGESRGDR